MSLLVNFYSFKDLSKYNHGTSKKSAESKSSKIETYENDPLIGDEDDDDNENILPREMPDLENICFNPPITKYYYRRARLHYREHKRALAPVHRRREIHITWNHETICAIGRAKN